MTSPPHKLKFPVEDIRVTLGNKEIWKAMYEVGTEMYISKKAVPLTPHLLFGISELDPAVEYSFSVHFNALGGSFQSAKHFHEARCQEGSQWMRDGIDFGSLRISSKNIPGAVQLKRYEAYLPVLTIHAAGVKVKSICFPCTKFATTSIYLNSKLLTLKNKTSERQRRKAKKSSSTKTPIQHSAIPHQEQLPVSQRIFVNPTLTPYSFSTSGPSSSESMVVPMSFMDQKQDTTAYASFSTYEMLPKMFNWNLDAMRHNSTFVVEQCSSSAGTDSPIERSVKEVPKDTL